jgi:hypothetical protein
MAAKVAAREMSTQEAVVPDGVGLRLAGQALVGFWLDPPRTL